MNRRMPNGTYWWCERGEKISPTRLPAYAEEMDTASLKVVNVFPHNVDNGLPALPAQVMLINGKRGVVEALMDGIYITQIRTGAASGAAFDLLAKKECKIGALIGTGGQAAAQLEAMMVARSLEEVRVSGLHYERTQAFAERMQEELKDYGVRIDTIPLESLVLWAFQRMFLLVGYKLATLAIWLPSGTVVPLMIFSSC